MNKLEHNRAISRVENRLLKARLVTDGKVDEMKSRTESVLTPKGRNHIWLNTLILASDKVWNRKLWRDYHK